MYRRTAHRGIAALALALTLILAGAQPAAAANRPVLDRFASFWGAVINAVPGAHAALNTLTGWFANRSQWQRPGGADDTANDGQQLELSPGEDIDPPDMREYGYNLLH